MKNYELAEFHKFKYNNDIYLFNVNRIKGYRIDDILSQEIDKLKNKQNFAIEEIDNSLLDALDKLNLLQDSSKSQKKDFNLPDRIPISSISLNVAQICNLKCIYCYGNEGEYYEKGLMSEEIAFKSVDWLIEQSMDLSKISIIFFGGEPLLNFPLIKKVVKYAKKRGAESNKEVNFSITTNGTLFNPEINQFLNKNKFSVTISFDGDAEIQNKNRPFKNGKGSYEVAKKKVVGFLNSREGKALGRATITGNNTDLKNIRKSLVDIGFKKISTINVTLPKSSKSQNADPVLTKFDDNLSNYATIFKQDKFQIKSRHYSELIKDLEVQAKETLECIKKRKQIYDRNILDFIIKLESRKPQLYFCGGGRTYFNITISGDIYPCHRMAGQKDKKIGHIKQWNSDVKKSYIKNHILADKKCKRCFARYQCGGGCFYECLENNGNMTLPNNEFCRQMRRKLELAIVIADHFNIFDKAYLSSMYEAIYKREITKDINA